MTVTDIVEIDKKKVKVFLEGKPYCALYKGEVRRYRIKKEEELSGEVLAEIEKILQKRCRERGLYLLAKKSYTEKEMREKLFMSFYPEEIICETISFLKKYSYLDDVRFVSDYLDSHWRKQSVSVMKYRLFAKGIERGLIEEILSGKEINPREAICRAIGRKAENFKEKTPLEKQKVYQMLLRKGFAYDDIHQVLKSYE